MYKDNYQKFVELFLRSIDEGSKRDLSNLDSILVNYLMNIIHILRNTNTDTLSDMKMFIEKYRKDYSYLYVIDCLGLPDLYALWFTSNKKGFTPLVKTFINIEATTKTFKEVFSAGTMVQVAIGLQGMVIKRLDTFTHSDMFARPHNREDLVKALITRMKYVEKLIPLEGATMIISDHGFDIVRKDSLYVIQHGHTKRMIFAKLALIMLVKK